MSSPDLIAALPVEKILEGLSVKLKAEQTLGLHILVAFEIADTDEVFTVEIRRGVAQFHQQAVENTDVRLTATRSTLLKVLLGQMTLAQGQESGEIGISGNESVLALFMESFEGPELINLTIR